MGNQTSVKVTLNSIQQLLADKGLSENGDVQAFHTSNVLRRIVKFIPYRSGATIKLTIVQTDVQKPEIVTDTPYAKYLYYGKVMVGSAPKVLTKRDLHYIQTKNAHAGSFWDRSLAAAEGAALQRDLQHFIDRKGGRKL